MSVNSVSHPTTIPQQPQTQDVKALEARVKQLESQLAQHAEKPVQSAHGKDELKTSQPKSKPGFLGTVFTGLFAGAGGGAAAGAAAYGLTAASGFFYGTVTEAGTSAASKFFMAPTYAVGGGLAAGFIGGVRAGVIGAGIGAVGGSAIGSLIKNDTAAAIVGGVAGFFVGGAVGISEGRVAGVVEAISAAGAGAASSYMVSKARSPEQ